MIPPVELITKDNLDLQFGTNVVGHWLLTRELLPLLEAGAKSSPDGKSRVVTTASLASELTSGINWDTLEDGPARKKLGTQALYFQSKFVSGRWKLSIQDSMPCFRRTSSAQLSLPAGIAIKGSSSRHSTRETFNLGYRDTLP